ncbi:hypothetical protein CJU90_4587 [Yarrowia sp. C11]|nr:hypothetical protein CJU90_4587 [Yarrowia sp. C11]KAG5370531.1 hypothetical protein CKK34_0636 [Yarrowia sp. E02]
MDWTKSFKISSGKPGRPVRLSGVEKTALQTVFDEHAEDGVISAFDVPLVIMDLGWAVEEFSGTENLDECVEKLKPHFLNDVMSFDDFSDGFSRMITRQVGRVEENGSDEDMGGFMAEEIADIDEDTSSEGAGGFVASDEDEGGFVASDEGGFVASEDEDGGGFFVASDGETGEATEPVEKPKKKKKKTDTFSEDVPLAFSWFTRSDTISTADLRRIAKLVKDNASEKDFKDMMEVAGAVGGKIDIQAFEGLLRKL